jgi:hypothetical protein
MKSLFRIRTAIAELRELHPDALATTSVQDLYELLIEFIELARFVRRNIILPNRPRTNPSFLSSYREKYLPDPRDEDVKWDRFGYPQWRFVRKEINPTQENVSGLIRVTLPQQPNPASQDELIFLELLQTDLIYLKRRVMASEPVKHRPRFGREISKAREKRQKRGSYAFRKKFKRRKRR